MAVQTNLFPTFADRLTRLLDPRRKFTVKFLADVTDGVMNGDPDRPPKNRVDTFTGHGLATDVSQKRIIRDNMVFLLENGYEVKPDADVPPEERYEYGKLYVAHRGILNANNEGVYQKLGISGYEKATQAVPEKLVEALAPNGQPVELPSPAYALVEADGKWSLTFDGSLDTAGRGEAEAAFKEIAPGLAPLVKKLHAASKTKTLSDTTIVALNRELCRQYSDVRLFGAVASTGNSCGNVKGPWQFGYGRSVDPIEAVNNSITRVAITKIEDMDKKRQDMGRKEPIPYALFEFYATYSPPLASRVGSRGITSEDLRLFWTALYNFGRFSGSSMRGHIELAAAYVFVHDHPLGNAHDHRLLDRVRVARREDVAHARKFDDYVVTVDDADLPAGVELVRLYERHAPTTDVPAPRPARVKA